MRRDDVSDTLLAELLDAVERDGDAVLQRFTRQRPDLAPRVQQLIARLASTGLLQPQPRCGRFRLEECIGRGAMGEVFRARDPELNRDVAIKRIAAHLTGNERATARFRREAQAIARLRHPAVVTVYGIEEHDGTPFLVMELVDGGSLREALSNGGERRLLGEQEVCRMGSELCAALQAAHDAGIVHRDVKPGNVLVRASGAPLLSDFGLALCSGDALMTKTGEFVGTPAYSSPEVLAGDEASVAGDVYSLASTLYECVAGRPPFVAATALEVAALAASSEVPPVRKWRPELSLDFEAVLMRALERLPHRRYASAAAFGDELLRVERGEPVHARRVGAIGRAWRWCRRRPAVATAICLPLLLVVAFTAIFVLWQSKALARYDQLADRRVLTELRREVISLWPADLPTIPRLQNWLRRARAVLDRESLHKGERDQLAGFGHSTGDGSLAFGEGDDSRAWQHEVLTEVVNDIETFKPVVAIMEFRLQVAHTLREVTLEEPGARAAWATAAAAIAASPRYGGFQVKPLLGLLPLDENPESGLWEFWHPASGARPVAAPAGSKSRWMIGPDTGMVFVLVPGGTRMVGVDLPSRERPVGSPHVSASGSKLGLGAVVIELRPYFLSKYEMTQAQYERLTGERPSRFDWHGRPGISPTSPVESVAYEKLVTVLPPARLGLPTDAQWEVAYRCGTTTQYPRGETVETMFGHDNVMDRAWSVGNTKLGVSFDPLDDRFATVGPVDAFQANAWGFHSMLGNVGEFCADNLVDDCPPRRPGDGLFGGKGSLVVVRGASWAHQTVKGLSGYTDFALRDRRSDTTGVRVQFLADALR